MRISSLIKRAIFFLLEPRQESICITPHWEIDNVPALEWFDPRNSQHILRIRQEAFTNIIKYTYTTEIRVATAADENDCVLVIIAGNE